MVFHIIKHYTSKREYSCVGFVQVVFLSHM